MTEPSKLHGSVDLLAGAMQKVFSEAVYGVQAEVEKDTQEFMYEVKRGKTA